MKPAASFGVPPIAFTRMPQTILKMWDNMTEPHRAAFLKHIGAKIVTPVPEIEPEEWTHLM